MVDMSKGIKSFYFHSDMSWAHSLPLSQGAKEELVISHRSPEGGTYGEFTFRWYKLTNNLHCKLEAYADGWHILLSYPELLEFMRESGGMSEAGPTPEVFRAFLVNAGYYDMSQQYALKKPTIEEIAQEALRKLTGEERDALTKVIEAGVAEKKPKEPTIVRSRRGGSHRMFGLNPKITKAQINKVLGLTPQGGDSGKSTADWNFEVNGVHCAIWDYNGSRWSCYGPKETFEKLFGAENIN